MMMSQHMHAQPHALYGPLGVNSVGCVGTRPTVGAAAPPRPMGGGIVHEQQQQPVKGTRNVRAAYMTEGAAALLPDTAMGAAALGMGRRPCYGSAEVFQCQEESLFYSQALEKLLPAAAAATPARTAVAVEFGTGDGTPVVNALFKTKFDGVIHGFELNPTSASLARRHARQFGLEDKYRVNHGCFFAGTSSGPAATASIIIANPPYLPAPDRDILMPELYGGMDGAELTRDLLSLGYQHAILLVASYSNPASVLRHAAAAGYAVADFLVTPLAFGTYSSQPKVRRWIAQMKDSGTAFYAGNTYLLSGALFSKVNGNGNGAPPRPLPVNAHSNGNGYSNGNGNGHSHSNGNAHSNGNGNGSEDGNGNGHSYGNGNGKAAATAAPAGGDLSAQLLRVLTAL